MKHHDITYNTFSTEAFDSVDELISENRDDLEAYIDRLFWWNERINLVSRDVSRETVWEHVRHSLLITQLKPYKKALQVVDAGTGGGLPGIPLSIVSSSEKSFLLNDIVTKKVLAVKQMVQTLSLNNITTESSSISEISQSPPFLLLSKHAFKINGLFHLTDEMPWSALIFYKGVEFEEELKGIETPLNIAVFDLFENSGDSFYEEKALIVITR